MHTFRVFLLIIYFFLDLLLLKEISCYLEEVQPNCDCELLLFVIENSDCLVFEKVNAKAKRASQNLMVFTDSCFIMTKFVVSFI